MSDEPLVTIITVVFNAKDQIEQTISSVFNQNYKKIEYIIIDGASTDGTLEIIKNFQIKINNGEFPNISYHFISEKDNGIYYAMNKGIDLATGEWINFMNAGDSFFSNNIIIDFLRLYDNESEIVYGGSNRIFKFGNFIDMGKLSNLIYMNNCHQAFFVKTFLLKINHFNIIYHICADANFFYEMYYSKHKFQYIPLIICNYENSEGFSLKNNKLYFKEKAIIEKINNTFKYKCSYFVFLLKLNIKKLIPFQLLELYHSKKLYNLFSNL